MPLGAGMNFFDPMGGLPESSAVHGQANRKGLVGNIVRRKQISLDLLAPNNAFFKGDVDETEDLSMEDEATSKLIFPLRFSANKQTKDEEKGNVEHVAPPIKRAGKKDKIRAGILAVILIAFVGVCVGWKTHEDESHSLFGLVGTACVTQCLGDKDFRNFFIGHEDHFHSKDVSC